MKRRVSLIAAACAMVSSVLLVTPPAEAQVRIAHPRPAIRSAVVVRPRSTVFVGGYYYPSIYRTSLWYGGVGFGFGYGYPYFGYGYYPGYYYAPSYYQWGPFGYDLSGSLRLQVEPEETEAFIDGYYAGQVDDFDGVFQRLHLEPGEHTLELYLAGHRTVTQRIYLQPGRTFRIRHTMQPLAAGDPVPTKPTGAPLPPPGVRDPRNRGQGPPPPPRGDAQGFGQLSLRVQPGDAEVVIDGERWVGALENERLNVQLGAALHRLEIRKDGYRSYFTDVTIRNGETLTLNVALTKQ